MINDPEIQQALYEALCSTQRWLELRPPLLQAARPYRTFMYAGLHSGRSKPDLLHALEKIKKRNDSRVAYEKFRDGIHEIYASITLLRDEPIPLTQAALKEVLKPFTETHKYDKDHFVSALEAFSRLHNSTLPDAELATIVTTIGNTLRPPLAHALP